MDDLLTTLYDHYHVPFVDRRLWNIIERDHQKLIKELSNRQRKLVLEIIDCKDAYVDECQLESDLSMSFSEEYVPTVTERMLLYRELDALEREEDVQAFRARMNDRFGPIPSEGEELIRVVSLRRLGKYFGCEKIILKARRMKMFFLANPQSPFFQSRAFGQVIAFSMANGHRCHVDQTNERCTLQIQEVPSVQMAVELLEQMRNVEL